nr:unnamed protein product [Callosobruchus chinensis]
MAKKKALTAAERQRRCREKRKNDPEKVAEVKRKDLERYHARKKLVADMSVREHRIMKRKWQQENKKRREKKQLLENVLLNSPPPSPIPELPEVAKMSHPATPTRSEGSSSRGRKKVKRDRTKLYSQDENKYKVLSNAIKERYKTVKCREEKCLIQSLFQTSITKESRMQTQLVRDSLGVDRPLKYKSVLPKQTDLVRRIHQFFLRDDVTRATAGKKETVTHKKWVRRSEVVEKAGKTWKISKNIPVTEKLTLKEVIQKFETVLQNFKTHVYNIRHQYKAYRQCINGLTESEVALHIDFSENYACKYHSEVQSHHFGGSRNQVTLHTAVMYHFSPEAQTKQVTSYCTVSSNQNHGPSAIWAHLHPILSAVQKGHPAVTTVHFFSDGPATQYKQKINFYLMATRFFEKYGFSKISWNFFESGHGKGAADGVGGALKRQADAIVARGKDISDAFQFFSTLQNASKVKLFMVTDEDIDNVAATIPNNIVPLKGTMQVHQMFSETYKILNHRVLSCFCQQFCSCHVPKTYRPLPEAQLSTKEKEDDTIYHALVDITNKIGMPRESFYDTVYSPDESSDEDQPLAIYKTKEYTNPTAISGTSYQTLQPEDIHPTKIEDGVHVLVKVRSERNIQYTYAGVAKSGVDEEGDVLVMFLKAVDDSGRLFKLVDNDLSDVPFDDLIKILPAPKVIKKGKRQFFEFDKPLSVFEK